jgi:hypothetical protein
MPTKSQLSTAATASPSHWTRRELFRGCAGAAAGSLLGCSSAPTQEFQPLFNGKDLTGWEGDSLLWIAEDGMLIGRSPGISYNDFLTTTERFGDFVLRLRFHLLNGTGNSGVQFRSERMTGSMEMIGYQADIGDTYWGSLYDESRRRKTLVQPDAALLERVLRPDDWNDYEVMARGSHIQLKLNGETTVDYEETEPGIPASGLIAVQVHSGPALEIRFKDIEIQRL